MPWVKFHDKLCRGAKRGLPRAARFVFMELCLEARPGRGVLDLPVGMSDIDALHDVLGGNRKELADALKLLTATPKPTPDDPEPRAMVELTGESGSRRLTIPSWEAWNSGHEAPGASTERSRRYRQRQTAPITNAAETQVSDADRNAENGDATPMQRPLHALPTVEQREGNGNATQYRGEERREEEIRSDPPYPPQGGGTTVGFLPGIDLSPPSPPPEPPRARRGREEKTESEQAYSDAYVAGQEDAEPGCGFRPLTIAACRLLGSAAQAHAKDRFRQRLTGEALVAWIRETSAAFRRSAEPAYAKGYSAHAFAAWLDAGRPSNRTTPLPEPVRIVIPTEVPPMPKLKRLTAEEQDRKYAEMIARHQRTETSQ